LLKSTESYLSATGFETGWLFEDIQESSLAIDSVALRIAYLFYDTPDAKAHDNVLDFTLPRCSTPRPWRVPGRANVG
jgi:hypothetical protein